MVAPAVVAIVVIVGRPWHPADDLAIIDLRVRDVWSVHFPLTGLFSRPGWNHPGPAMFWFIAILSGVTDHAPWATRVGGPILAAIAFASLAIVTPRAGRGPLLAAAAMTGLTFLGFEPWVAPDDPGPLEDRERDLAAMTPAIRADHVAGRAIFVSTVGGTLPTLFGGVIDELDRPGAHVLVRDNPGRVYGEQRRVGHRTVDQTWFVTEQGSLVPGLLAQRGARLLAYSSPLTASENRELDRLQSQMRTELGPIGQGRAVANLDQTWFAWLLRDVDGIDHAAAQRISELNMTVARHDDCRCAIVVVPGAPARRGPTSP